MVLISLAGIPPLRLADTELFSARWLTFAGISLVLVVFAGLMSGLTLGLMSLSLVELEVLQRSGTSAEKEQAGRILPVVQKQHQLLVTLLLCNAAAMEALPIFLDDMFNPVVAIILSVTFVLIFGEVIPQAICSRYGLAVGAYLVWLVRLLMIVCYPVAYPVGKILDFILGHNESALFRRAQLKALVTIHSQEAGKGGELTHDEATIISGALDMTEKTADAAMTPIESVFSLDINSKLDQETIGNIIDRGHSRVPVYSGNPRNLIGVLLVKFLLTVRPETGTSLGKFMREMPRVPADMALYDILNQFQKGSSHMAAVIKGRGKIKNQLQQDKENANATEKEFGTIGSSTALLSQDERSESVSIDVDKLEHKLGGASKSLSLRKNDAEVVHSIKDVDKDEVVGIITLEDVFEELLQEEIVDETDKFIDVHNRVHVVAAAAAASSLARATSFRKLSTPRATERIGDDKDELVDVPRIRKATAVVASSMSRASSFKRLSTPKASGDRSREAHQLEATARKPIEERTNSQKGLLAPLIDK